MSSFSRLLAYARPYRGRLAAAVAAMLFYAAASAGLVTLIKPLMDSVLSRRLDLTFWGIPVDLRTWSIAVLAIYFFKGLGAYFSTYLMTDVGTARGARRAQSAVPPHPESVGELFQSAHERPADVGHHQRRPADSGRGVGDRRRPPARGALRAGICVPDVLLRCPAGARRRHRRADRRLSAGAARPARAPHEPARAGGAGLPVAHHHRSLHGPSDRQGLRRRGA